MRPQDCPKFHTCNTSVCPLDLSQGYHVNGERVCFYLRESGKAGAEERFAGDEVFAECVRQLPAPVAKWPSIGKAVEAAAKSQSRRELGKARAARLLASQGRHQPLPVEVSPSQGVLTP